MTASRIVTPVADDAGRAATFRLLQSIVEPLAASLPTPSEVVLHDLDLLPNSIVAIAGDLTRRKVGGAATDLLLRGSAKQNLDTMVGYETTTTDGRRLRSTTMVLKDADNRPIAALCINTDVTAWESVRAIAESMLGLSSTAPTEVGNAETETFVTDLDELSAQMLSEAIATVPVSVDLMRKAHKLAVVAELRSKGFFLLKESVETAAKALGVTRFTIYNYINELSAADEKDSSGS